MSRVDPGVNNKLSHGKVLVPVVLSTTNIEAEVLLDFLVGPFSLSVGLRVVGGGEVGLNAEALEEGAHDLGSKLRAAIADEPEWETVEAEDFSVVDVGYAFSGDVGSAGEGVEKFTVMVDKDNDSVVAVSVGELSDEVNSNSFPWAVGNIQRLSRSARVLGVLFPCADVATFYILLDESSHSRPPVLSFDSFEGSMYARMSGGGVVVALLEDSASEFVVWRDIDTTLVVHQTVVFFPFGETGGETART